MAVIDVHAHYYPESYPALLKAHGFPADTFTRMPIRARRRFTYDTVCHSGAITEFMVKLVGTERIVLGSDFCFDMAYERPVEALGTLGALAAPDRANILGGNAASLLGI